MTQKTSRKKFPRIRTASIVVWAAVLMVLLLGMVAFGIDIGYMALTRTQLQTAADAAAIAAAPRMNDPWPTMFQTAGEYAGYHSAGGATVSLDPTDVEYGTWDSTTRTFAPTQFPSNALRITARRTDAAMFFGRIFGRNMFDAQASAVAVANPRDIVFVVDLSGSMNDDTEPAWATSEINEKFAPDGYPTIGNQLMQQLYDDFGYGTFPGSLQFVGAPLGVVPNRHAYAEMTKDGGPLTPSSIPVKYRIRPSDNEPTRKVKAYSWMIDYQIASMMPNAKPVPSSSTNYSYWSKYLDYIIHQLHVSVSNPWNPPSSPPSSPPPSSPPIGMVPEGDENDWFAAWQAGPLAKPAATGGLLPVDGDGLALGGGVAWQALLGHAAVGAPLGTPPNHRGWLPPDQSFNRIDTFNNPNPATFPTASVTLTHPWRNHIGYLTYVQFMADFGRDLRPDGQNHVPLSLLSPYCPLHMESTPGGTFTFPPRAQPEHAARRALIAAIQVVKERNDSVPDPNFRDWVSVVSFDTLIGGGPQVVQSLTSDYDSAMEVCTTLQAVGDIGPSTATEPGLIAARNHIKSRDEGGEGRRSTNKVVVLLTDGVPNLYQTSHAAVDSFMVSNSSSDWYGGDYPYDAALMQARQMHAEGWHVYPVGIGLGTDYDFMDRLARMGGTANDSGESPRGSGNPAQYEQRLVDIFTRIINTPRVRLVD